MSASIRMQTRPTLAQLNERFTATQKVRDELTKAYWVNSPTDNGEAFQAWLGASDAYDAARDAVMQRHDELRSFDCDPKEVDYLIAEAASHDVKIDARIARDMLFCSLVEHNIEAEISPWEEDAHLLADAEHSDAASYEERR